MHGGSLEIKLTVPLSAKDFFLTYANRGSANGQELTNVQM